MKTIKERLLFDSSLPQKYGEAPAYPTLIREFSGDLYSRLAEENDPAPSPLTLGDVRIVGGMFMSERKFQLSDPRGWVDFFGGTGEILVRGSLELWQIKILIKMKGEIVYYSDMLIYMRAPDIEARFSRVTLDKNAFEAEFIARTESDKARSFLIQASKLFCDPIYSRIIRFVKTYIDLSPQDIIDGIPCSDVALFAAAIGMPLEKCEDYKCDGKTHIWNGKVSLCAGTLRELGADMGTPENELREIAKKYIIGKFGKNGELPC